MPVKGRLGAADLRKRAWASQDIDQARRLLALAAVLDGRSRGAAARIGGMDRQTLRDLVHAYNAKGPNGLINAISPGRPPIPLPPKSPELNARENIWQYLRQNFLSNRLFASYEAILDACQHVWCSLTTEAGRFASILALATGL